MSLTPPYNKPIFQTPARSSKNQNISSFNKDVSPSTIQPKNLTSSFHQTSSPFSQSYMDTHAHASSSKQIKIKISQKSMSPYPANQSVFNPEHIRSGSRFRNCTHNELVDLLLIYESQIEQLKQEIHRVDLLDRKRIVEIFDFDYGNCPYRTQEQSKYILKQLKQKVAVLVLQNKALKSSSKSPITKHSYYNDQLLMKQNDKLKTIIQEFKSSEDASMNKLKNQAYKLKVQNEELKKENGKLKNRIDTLEQVQSYKQSRASEKNREYRQKIPVFVENKTVKGDSSNSSLGHDKIGEIKQQFTKQVLKLEQQMCMKDSKNQGLIQILCQKVQKLENKLKQYQKYRKMKVEETIRKSFNMTKSLNRHEGDGDQHGADIDELNESRRQMKPSIFGAKVSDIKDKNEELNSPTFRMFPEEMNNNFTFEANEISGLKSELKIMEDSLAMEKMKNKNVMEENNIIKTKLKQVQNKLSEKIDSNIRLEGILAENERIVAENERIVAENERIGKNLQKSMVSNGEIEEQIRLIRQNLHSCNVNNFEIIFKEFNQILEKRKNLSATVEEYQTLNKSRDLLNQKQLQQRQSLEKKVYQLIDENKRLMKRISEMEADFRKSLDDSYHTEIDRLNSIKSTEMLTPNGDRTLQWQKKVKDSIQQSMVRLERLSERISGDKHEKTVDKSSWAGDKKKIQLAKSLRSSAMQ